MFASNDEGGRGGALLVEQADVLEMIVRGHPLPDVLAALCRIAERHASASARAAILLVDAHGRLWTGAAPSLPASYCAAIDGLAIAPGVGTCADAAARAEVVVTPDFALDRGWDGLRHLPLAIGLAGAWSMPIRSATNAVLGTFGTYFAEPRAPTLEEIRIVEVLARTAALAIERHRADAATHAHAVRHRFLAELAAATQPLTEAPELMATSARLLADHLDVDRCVYAEVVEQRFLDIMGDHARGIASLRGRWSIAALGPACAEALAAGATFVIEDTVTDPRIAPGYLATYRAADVRAGICAPLHKDGVVTATLAVHHATPRRWTADEIELVTLVAARCWEALARARITRTLRESEARYRAIVEATPECVKVIDQDGVLLQMNPAGLRMVEASSPAEVIGHPVHPLVAPEHRERFRAFVAQTCRGEPSRLEFDIVGLAGTRRSMESTAVPLPSPGGGHVLLAITRDVSARVASERALSRSRAREREEQARLARIAAAALVIHSASTVEDVLRVVTEEARQLIGAHQAVSSLTTGAGAAQRVSTVSLSERYAGYRGYGAPPTGEGIYGLVCRTGKPLRLTHAELLAHPGWRDFSGEAGRHPPLRGWLAVPMLGRSGGCLGLVQLSDKVEGEFTAADEAILVQLAQLAAVALENARLYDRLRDQDRRKDEFLATLAHELRNPLAPIRTGLHVLSREVAAEQAGIIRAMMERQLGHLVHLVDDLLDISRITLGKITLKLQRTDLRAVLDSALETARPVIEAGGHHLVVELPDRPLPIDVDPTRVSQVFANLINNAAKYTPGGGVITVRATVADDALEVRVTDTGVGLPDDMLERVFDIFTQVDSSLARAQGGLGIGLTLVRGLVELHGGTIAAESAGPGRGSTFVIRTALAPAAAAVAAPPAPGLPVSGPPLKILVVDDNVDGAESLGMLLELSGNQIRLAHDGLAALDAAGEFHPDVVLLDIGLPGLDGYEVARRLRADPRQPAPMLVAVTGWGTDEDRRQARAAGFDRHLVKPVDAGKLAAVLADARA